MLLRAKIFNPRFDIVIDAFAKLTIIRVKLSSLIFLFRKEGAAHDVRSSTERFVVQYDDKYTWDQITFFRYMRF